MTGQPPLTDYDLFSFADGRLDDDPVRKARVEALLRSSPELAARVRDYRAQSAAIRERYGARAAEPVPERLLAAVNARPVPWLGQAVKLAAVIALTLGASAAGWFAGRQATGPEVSPAAFLEQSYRSFLDAPAGAAAGFPAGGGPVGWHSDDISLTFRAPNLSGLGFAIADRRTVDADGAGGVRIEYAARDGRRFSLFLRPRWDDRRDRDPEFRSEGDVSMAYWLDGPLASAIATRLPAEQARRIADAVQRSIRANTLNASIAPLPSASGPHAGRPAPAPSPAHSTGGVAVPAMDSAPLDGLRPPADGIRPPG